MKLDNVRIQSGSYLDTVNKLENWRKLTTGLIIR